MLVQRSKLLNVTFDGVIVPVVAMTLANALIKGSPGFSTRKLHDKQSGPIVSFVMMRRKSSGVVVGAVVPEVIVDTVDTAEVSVVTSVSLVVVERSIQGPGTH